MHPGVKQDIGALKSHLRCVAGGKVLYMHGRRNHGAGHTQTLGNMALHLRPEQQLRVQGPDLVLHIQVVVGNQRLDAIPFGSIPHFARKLTAVGAKAHHLKAHLLVGHARSSYRVGGIAKNKHPLAGEVGGID